MKTDYGIDAPTVVRNLALGGLASLLLALFRVDIRLGPVLVLHTGWYFAAAGMLGAGLWMLYESKVGKYGHRDRMLKKISWSGDERVLDVGTGRGLLLIGAAKHLTTGRAIGIDIWQSKDLSGNTRERTEKNIRAEGVWERCELHHAPAQQMRFLAESFDVVVSNQCLHNIPSGKERDQACAEILRVLKPGGRVVISDFLHTGRYAKLFREAGLTVQMDGWFPPSRIIFAVRALP